MSILLLIVPFYCIPCGLMTFLSGRVSLLFLTSFFLDDCFKSSSGIYEHYHFAFLPPNQYSWLVAISFASDMQWYLVC